MFVKGDHEATVLDLPNIIKYHLECKLAHPFLKCWLKYTDGKWNGKVFDTIILSAHLLYFTYIIDQNIYVSFTQTLPQTCFFVEIVYSNLTQLSNKHAMCSEKVLYPHFITRKKVFC